MHCAGEVRRFQCHRVKLPPVSLCCRATCGCAVHSGGGGRWFKSTHSDHLFQTLSRLPLPTRWPNNCPIGQKPLSSRRDACRCARGGGAGKTAAWGTGRAVILEIRALTRIRPVRTGNPRNVSTWGESLAATRRFGIDSPEAVGKLRESAAPAVLNACGVPVSLATDADGTSKRESYRRFVIASVEPVAGMIAYEVSCKLDLLGCALTSRAYGRAKCRRRPRVLPN